MEKADHATSQAGTLEPRVKRRWLTRLQLLAITMLARIKIHWLFPVNPRIRQGIAGNTPNKYRKLCVFAAYSTSGLVPDHTYFYLRALREADFDVVFVTTAATLHVDTRRRLRALCATAIRRENTGLDFGSWKAGLLYSGVQWQKYKKILFANDSCYAPLHPLREILDLDDRGVVSMTDSFEQEPHLMSYFLLCHADVIHHPDFVKFWQSIRMVPTRLKPLIVQLYEIGFSRYFRKRGFKLRAAFPVTEIARHFGLSDADLRKTNPTHKYWRYLIEARQCPILKVDLFKRDFKPNNDDSWREVVSATGYDINLILQHQGLHT